ncbi:MAG TPA: Trm112 family protein [Gemmatimonadota bacterium]|nr:Trm112 family protein [Gemmatimonadota bacterium]
MALDTRLLEIIVCPRCRGELAYDEEKSELRCPECRLVYRIDGDIPILLIDEAVPY